MAGPDSTFRFSYYPLDTNGNLAAIWRKKGIWDGEVLTLSRDEIPIAEVLEVLNRGQTIQLILVGSADELVETKLIRVTTASAAATLKKQLDNVRSELAVAAQRRQLEKSGSAHAFTTTTCPHCDSTILLTEYQRTPQIYCHYCDSLTTPDGDNQLIKVERSLGICDECGMYSQPQQFTIFYFYFLIVMWGWYSRQTFRCPGCMRRDAWKMLFGNMLFLLGIPVALVQLYRVYSADVIGGPLKGLDTANIAARKGDVSRAVTLYKQLLDRLEASAGVKYNVGLALLGMDDRDRATEAFEVALEDCGNYGPAFQYLCQLYTVRGEQEKLDELNRRWNILPHDEDAQFHDEDEVEFVS